MAQALVGWQHKSWCRHWCDRLHVGPSLSQQHTDAFSEVETVKDADNPSTVGALDEDDRKLGEQWLVDLDFKLMFPTLDARRCSHSQTSAHSDLVKEYAPPLGVGQHKSKGQLSRQKGRPCS
jgi:hypothetical protein